MCVAGPFVSHVLTEVSRRIEIYRRNRLPVVYDDITGANHCGDVLPAQEQQGHGCRSRQPIVYLPSNAFLRGEIKRQQVFNRKTNGKSVRKRFCESELEKDLGARAVITVVEQDVFAAF